MPPSRFSRGNPRERAHDRRWQLRDSERTRRACRCGGGRDSRAFGVFRCFEVLRCLTGSCAIRSSSWWGCWLRWSTSSPRVFPGAVTYSSLSIVSGAPVVSAPPSRRATGTASRVGKRSPSPSPLAGPRTGECGESRSSARASRSRWWSTARAPCARATSSRRRPQCRSARGRKAGVFRDFVAGGGLGGGRPDDLVGLVSFARYADSLCPLTLDHGNLLTILEDLEIVTRARRGWHCGRREGSALAVERLREHPAAYRRWSSS